MPKLKKYSQIYGDDSNSINLAFSNENDKKSNQKQKTNLNSNAQKQQNASISSQSQQSDEQSKKQCQQSRPKIIKQKRQKQTAKCKKQKDQIIQQKRKRSASVKKKNKYDANQILKKMQEQLAHNQDNQNNHKDNESQTGIQIPDDFLVGCQNKKNKNKKNKNQIKSKNKFFSFENSQNQINPQNNSKNNQEDVDQQQLKKLDEQRRKFIEQKNLNNIALMDARKNQLQNKVNRIRERLQFKNAHQDTRYKQHIKQTLEGVKDCQNVQIMIEAPKIFKGSTARHTDGALLIKNMSQNATPRSQSVFQDDQSKSLLCDAQLNNNKLYKAKKNIDRKQFYQQFGKQVKQTKIFDIRNQRLDMFKKSSLDELGQEFDKNQHLFKQETNSRRSLSVASNKSNKSSSDMSIGRISASGLTNSRGRNQEVKMDQKSQGYSKKMMQSKKQIQIVQQDQSNQDSKNIIIATKISNNQTNITVTEGNINSKLNNISYQNIQQNKNKPDQPQKGNNHKTRQNKSQKINKNKQKDNKKKRNGQKVSKQIKQLFEQQAEDSQNGYGDDGYSSGSNDDSSIQSLIDRKDVKYVQKNEIKAMKKFIEQEHRRDQLIIQRIKQKITKSHKIKCQQNSQSRKRRKRRISEARKKFQEEDGQNDGKFEDYDKQKRQNYKQRQQNDNFEQQLKSFQDDLRIKQSEKQDSKIAFTTGIFSKNKLQWKEIKTVNKAGNSQKRGGFVNKSKIIIGPKMQTKKNTKNSSKEKHINF